MKKIFVRFIALLALPVCAHAAIINNNPDATNALGVANATSEIGFTNTVFQSNDLSGLQVSNVVTLLLSLQTNMEASLIVLSSMTTNATAVEVSSGIPGAPNPFPQPFGAPITNSIQLTAIVVPVGTNILFMSQDTFQALSSLQNDLAGALPILQSLNGTEIGNTNINGTQVSVATTNRFPSFTPPFTPPLNRSPFISPLTNGFTNPLSNQSPPIGPISPIVAPPGAGR